MYESLKVTALDLERGDGAEPGTVPVRLSITLEGRIPSDCDHAKVDGQWLGVEIERAVHAALNDRKPGGELAARIRVLCEK